MYGIDISNYQKALDIKSLKSEFVIVKATEGIGYTDPSFENFCNQLENTDKLVGFYHFARPDKRNDAQDMMKEAEWFLRIVQSTKLYDKSILVLDWEREPFDKEVWLQTWLEYVYNTTGKIPFIYGSRSKLKSWENWAIMNAYPIWMAVWPSIKRYEEGVNPGLNLPKVSFEYQIWQYSNIGFQNGKENINIDLDYSSITKEEWHRLANYEEKEEITEDMQWAIDCGLFVGYPDGKYHPKDPLTREQMASVLRRYNSGC